MVQFFQSSKNLIYALEFNQDIDPDAVNKLSWLLDGNLIDQPEIQGTHIGPRKEMLTPWSTNAVEIAQNMGLQGITRIEKFFKCDENSSFDPMLEAKFTKLDQTLFTINHPAEPVVDITDIYSYNKSEGLALSDEEVKYLENVSKDIGRNLTDGEVFGFSQVNSEHCRHKIFNGTFIIDGIEKKDSLFKLIRKTSSTNPNRIISAYKDNVAFVKGPKAIQFAPVRQDTSDYFETKPIETVISLKAETHNFPTTVEPFNGAATGSGGEIRDRMAGGTASIPLAGTAVYMTSYSRTEDDRQWEIHQEPREWLYQSPVEILIKASNGASDFGNKFGQPLIAGSLLTFENKTGSKTYGFDKVIMLAGGIGFGKLEDAQKHLPEKGDKIVVLGGDNYRIGMGGGSVSSVATGEYQNSIELNAIQRSNPEMQKRVFNAIRAMSEAASNPIVSIHDHGAGGHLNCLSELVESSGGTIHIENLPVGDPTLSSKEIIGNESQERMGLVIKEEDLSLLQSIAKRERAPMYVVGEVTGDMVFKFQARVGKNPIDLPLAHFFGSSPKTVLRDNKEPIKAEKLKYSAENLEEYIEGLLQMEAVACKDWLTNKVDRSVTGKVAVQQCTGPIQLPLNNLGVMAIDYIGEKGIATSIGHAPVAALLHPAAGSRLSITEALTNIIWAPLTYGINGISLSANWMWPAKNPGEDSRLYEAVEAVSDFVIGLGINVPTGKDSLSMTQKYPNGEAVYAPGTVIISAAAEVIDIKKVVTPTISDAADSSIWYVPMGNSDFELGGSSFAQLLGELGEKAPDVTNPEYVVKVFEAVQDLIKKEAVLSGHDISSGGLITSLLEMTFSTNDTGIDINLGGIGETDLLKILFSESPGLIIQFKADENAKSLLDQGIVAIKIGKSTNKRNLKITHRDSTATYNIDHLRNTWYKSSYLLDSRQTSGNHAKRRYENFANQPLEFKFPENYDGSYMNMELDPVRKNRTGIKAAIIREKGVNGDREMAYAMHLAGFDVKDVHMTDLIAGRENLQDINFIVFVGGFSNSDVLGSAKGWAGAFLYNQKARKILDDYYSRNDTLSLGVCNGCQLMMELGLLYPELKNHPKMHDNVSGKFESAFLTVTIPANNSIMLKSLSETQLGIWVAHGEGKFDLPEPENYSIAGKFTYSQYPGNPNGSDLDAAILISKNGRHTAMMPHLERSIFPWQWPYYPEGNDDNVTPWMEVFISAHNWVMETKSN